MGDDDNPEDPHERRNRQLDQLLQETRVVMPGVQVLFAFLLAVAFQNRWCHVVCNTTRTPLPSCTVTSARSES